MEQENLLHLIKMFGLQEREDGGSTREPMSRTAAEWFERVTAALPQQPVQARDSQGRSWWIHGCGEAYSEFEPPGSDHCGKADPDSWRPLLVGGDPAPEQPGVPGSTVSPHRYERGPYAVDGSQVCGLCGERRAAAIHRSEQPSAPDFLAAVNKLTMEREDWKRLYREQTSAGLELCGQRDEARAEIAKLKGEIKMFTDVFGAQPAGLGGLRLTLPEVPDGTVALVGVGSGVRYSFDAERDEWSYPKEDGGRWFTNYQAIMNKEHPHGVTVELAVTE